MSLQPIKVERAFIWCVLILLTVLRIAMSMRLQELGVFDQYNVLFDADPNHYVLAIANGWGFGPYIHPGFALLINVPVRALDFVGSYAGLVSSGTVRQLAPIFVSPIAASVGGWLWWLAAARAGFTPFARICGFLLFQAAFSQTVFSVLPESYAISGALLSVLLVLTVNAARNPTILELTKVRIQWLVLACLMSMITVTNGLLCIAVWMGIRFEARRIWPLAKEALVAGLLLSLVVVASLAADHRLYDREAASAKQPDESPVVWTKRFMPGTSLDNVLQMPASFVTSVFPPALSKVENLTFEPGDRYQFGIGLERVTKSQYVRVFGWIMLIALGGLVLRQQGFSVTVRAIAAVLLFNGGLHTFFGREMFLYSQHWLAFMVFALVVPFGGKASRISSGVLLIYAGSASVMSVTSWTSVFAILSAGT